MTRGMLVTDSNRAIHGFSKLSDDMTQVTILIKIPDLSRMQFLLSRAEFFICNSK